MNMLNKDFLKALEAVNNYTRDNEYSHFCEESENFNLDHIYLQALKVDYFLGNNTVNKEIAQILVKLGDLSPFMVLCKDLDNMLLGDNEEEYTEVNNDDLNDGEFPEDWENFIINLKNEV